MVLSISMLPRLAPPWDLELPEKQEIVSILRKLQTHFEDTLFGLIPCAFNIFIFHNIKLLLLYVHKGSGVSETYWSAQSRR
jgi:hypothetical protein